MKLVLLSGGSGKRLWPLSNDSRSKQFLKVLQNNDGHMESMVQRVWRQLERVNLKDSAVVATSKSQLDMITNQLGIEVPLIVEPERRDTFPAIALAATYIYSKGVNLDEVIVVLPVDPYVEEGFFNKIKEMEDALNSTQANIALLGVIPSYPSEKYGYIVPESQEETSTFLKVSHFKEKPTESQAIELINQKALWNCGVFGFKLDYIISLLLDKGFPIKYEELLKKYSLLPKISFDYEVVENAKQIVTLSYDGFWKDLGTWNTLTEEMDTNLLGNGIISKDSINTHIINELDIPVTVLGLSNVVVAASPDGILVSEKNSSPRIKEMDINFDKRPMYEERGWGWYKVLDYSKFEDNEVLTKRIGIKKDNYLSYQRHNKRKEVWTIISGNGIVVLNEEIIHVNPGDVIQIPVGARHSIKAITELQFIEVQNGSELIEEDVYQLHLTWFDIMENCFSK
ncbi:sugar phosphate nucleotidyltransferase [Paenibacillus sp. 2RAB27]|uniref:sugar phosphate nucleotidyltransferase n=1 Tax=Paenibacillus sp. 2RAB27 TaxID=3232991 RepID=UPI003F9DD3C7